MDSGVRVSLNGSRGKHRLQAAAIAAGADNAIRVHGDVTDVPGYAGVPTQKVAVDQGCTAHTVAQCEHEDVLPPTRSTPNNLAGQGDAGVVIGEHGDLKRQADNIHDAQSLQEV